MTGPRVGVLGAGAIGGYLGVRLAAAGARVVLVGRRPLVEASAEGLVAQDLDGREVTARPSVTEDPAALAEAEVCLLGVKSRDLEAVVPALNAHLPEDATVVTLQNGLSAADRLRSAGLARPVVSGLVVFNGPCALTGLPLRRFLESRDARRALALLIREGLRVFRAAGRPVRGFGRIDPRLVARVLPLPDLVFFRLAKAMLTIDPEARTSTLQDLDWGRRTEIDALAGAVVEVARAAGTAAPMHAWVVDPILRRKGGLDVEIGGRSATRRRSGGRSVRARPKSGLGGPVGHGERWARPRPTVSTPSCCTARLGEARSGTNRGPSSRWRPRILHGGIRRAPPLARRPPGSRRDLGPPRAR